MAQSRLKQPKKETTTTKRNIGENKYLQHLPMLLVALIAVAWSWAIVTQYYPSEVANTLLYQGYLPILIPVFIAISFSFGFLFLSLQKGVIISWLLTILLFFRLQSIEVNPTYYFSLFGITLFLLYFSKLVKT